MRKLTAIAILALISLLISPLGSAEQGAMPKIADTVLKMPLAEGVTADSAIESMKLRANALNFKLVAHLPLSQQLRSMGIESRRVEIFQFCDAIIAHDMLAHDIDFSPYLPCRITLIEDRDGHTWLVTLDLDLVIRTAELPPDLLEKAIKVRDTLREIMEAGASGDL
ncbi:MAG: DUF302 domain-containing protein [Chromatiaceae bacterium]|nr:DUF302 domain-containing protein [Chromatiaceae bacterium]